MITIRIEPVAKGRAKTAFRNGRAWAYTPKKTKDAETELRLLIQQQLTYRFPEHTPVKLAVGFYRTQPKSSKDALPVRMPDLDNLLKWVCDCLNGLAFPDDAAITSITTIKRWSTTDYPYLTIELKEDTL